MSPAAGSGVSECPNQLLARMLLKAMKAPMATMAALTPMRPGAVQALPRGHFDLDLWFLHPRPCDNASHSP
jgi:hypothetical protein